MLVATHLMFPQSLSLTSLTTTLPPSSSVLISSLSLANTSMSSLNHCTEGFGVPRTFTANSTFSCSRAMVSLSMRTK